MMNPITALINGYRKTLLQPPSVEAIGGPSLPLDIPALLITGVVSFLILLGSYAYFNKRKWEFTERP
jgi:ABC-type polysaccharide/polyol phosphate export permease